MTCNTKRYEALFPHCKLNKIPRICHSTLCESSTLGWKKGLYFALLTKMVYCISCWFDNCYKKLNKGERAKLFGIFFASYFQFSLVINYPSFGKRFSHSPVDGKTPIWFDISFCKIFHKGKPNHFNLRSNFNLALCHTILASFNSIHQK